MLNEFSDNAMQQALYEEEAGHWYGQIPDFPGVLAEADSRPTCEDLLREVLEEWLLLKIKDGDGDIPIVDNLDLNAIGVKEAWDVV